MTLGEVVLCLTFVCVSLSMLIQSISFAFCVARRDKR